VTWVGHSTVLLQLGPLNVLTDPMWSERASPARWVGPRRFMTPAVDFDELPEIHVVLLSHNHYDHLDAPTVRRMAERYPETTWLCPMGLGTLLQSLGVRKTVERDWWETVDAQGFSAACVPAQHFSSRTIGDRGDTLWCGWTIQADGVRIFFAGDTALHPEFDQVRTRLGPFDLVMLPIGAYEPRWFMRPVHMNPAEAVQAHLDIGARVSLGMHFGTFQLTDEAIDDPLVALDRALDDKGIPDGEFTTLDFGESVVIPAARAGRSLLRPPDPGFE